MRLLNMVGQGLKEVLKLTVIGGLTSAQQGLHNTSKSMVNNFNGGVVRSYDHYAKPQIERGIRLVKRNKTE